MFVDNFIFPRPNYISMALLALLVMTMFLFRIEDHYQLCLLLMAGGLAWMGIMPLYRLSQIDMVLCLITAYELISCCWAVCLAPAVRMAFYYVFGLTVYFFLRYLQFNNRAVRVVCEGSYFPIAIALLLTISSFWIFRSSVLSAGFANTYHFRFLFRPLGYITNEWAEILLMLLGWICLVRRYSALFIFMCIEAILLSFSRAAYISLLIYLLGAFCWMKFRKDKIHLMIIGLLAVVLTFNFLPSEMKTTLQMNSTVSQRQSAKGRIDAIQAAWKVWSKHPLLGYGNGNFTYAIDHDLNQDSTRSYTSFAPNIMIQFLVEKGIIGITLYGILALVLIFFIWKHWCRHESRIVACILLAVFLKEMAQAILLCTSFTFVMLYVFFAFLQNGEKMVAGKENMKRTEVAYAISTIALIVFIVWNIPGLRAMEQTPKWVNKALVEMKLYELDKNRKHLYEAEVVLKKAIKANPDDLQIIYLQARSYLLRNETSQAEALFKKLVLDYPRNSLYLLGLSDVQYQQGKKEEALLSFINAVRFTPRLLTNKRIKVWKQDDTLFYEKLLSGLSGLKPILGATPIDYARYGYIARWCNNPIADTYLRQAIVGLPNLAIPWYLLGDNQKYKLLAFGAFQKNLKTDGLPKELEMTDELMLNKAYFAKFNEWYGCELETYQ